MASVTLTLKISWGKDALTNSTHMTVLSCHHESCFPCMIHSIHLSAVTQEELEALHVIRKGCCVKGRPVGQSHTARTVTKELQYSCLLA